MHYQHVKQLFGISRDAAEATLMAQQRVLVAKNFFYLGMG